MIPLLTLSFDGGIIYYKRVPCHRLESPPHDPAPPASTPPRDVKKKHAVSARSQVR